MSSSGGLIGSSLISNLNFNWVFLVELSVCVVVAIFFLFYFNRLFATLVSYGIRTWTWHKYRVFIDFQALQLSLLGGRIFFKGLRYHGNNETILIQSGFITWRYWLRKVREVDVTKSRHILKKTVSFDSERDGPDGSEGAQESSVKHLAELPCRLSLTISGAEWFIYNRSAAYDSLIAGLTEDNDPGTENVDVFPSEMNSHSQDMKNRFKQPEPEKTDELSKATSADLYTSSKAQSMTEKEPTITLQNGGEPINSSFKAPGGKQPSENTLDHVQDSLLLQILPIQLDCSKAAVVMGNENTSSVLIVKLDGASGQIDASACRYPDQYRNSVNFHFEHPVVQIKPNDDYKEDQAAAAIRVKQGLEQTNHDDVPARHHSLLHRFRRRTWHRLQNLIPYFRRSVESFSSSNVEPAVAESTGQGPNVNQWHGLSRYLDESEQDDNSRWSNIEYASVSTIVDSSSATMSYFWDVPGTVPAYAGHFKSKSQKPNADINGDLAPEWGLDLTIRAAMINYGPWADRQRADLQRVFFPSLCKDATPAKMRQPGQARLATKFKLYLQLDDETTLRVPIREESKNWKWTAQANAMDQRLSRQKQRRGKHSRKKKGDKGTPGPEIRPLGWLDIKVAANATVTYTMDMFAHKSGFSNRLDIDIPNTEITTSVNHGLLWRSVDQRLSCDLSNPLEWNGLHNWKFDITSNGLELFILREHIFLLIDLVNDWATGPPPDYLTFTPFRYLLHLSFGDFRLYLNANDSNIINNPSDFDDNTFLIIFGTALVADLCIPLDKFRPHQNDIIFDVKAHSGGLNLHVPPWNTQATFLTSTELARLKDLAINGKYQYCATTSTSNTDTLLLDVSGGAFEIQLFGFLVRYVLRLKENYFGDDIRFKTLEEYQQILREKEEPGPANLVNTPPHKKTNDLDVILSVHADDISALLPTNLYCAKQSVKLELAYLAVDLRFTNYYMDMQLSLSPISFLLSNEDDSRIQMSPRSATSGSQLFVDGVDVFGHRVFGLPPSEPTYVCNWDFAIGTVTGECSVEFLSQLIAGAHAFAFSFDDDENALPSISTPQLHDITFLRAAVEPIHIWIHVEDVAFMVSTGAITATFNDWAGSHFSKKLKLEVPDLRLSCVDAESASRHRSRANHPVETHAYVKTAIALSMIDRKLKFAEDLQLQQMHIRREDLRTHRADFLLHPKIVNKELDEVPTVDPPAMCFPPLPLPLKSGDGHADDRSSLSGASSLKYARRRIQRKASFLSVSSLSYGSQKSIIRPRSNLSRPERGPVIGVESPSRSRHASTHHTQGSRLRDFSTSTGRQSSFYSAVADHGDRRGLPPSSMTFASAYIAPYFPLENVEPNPKDLPKLTARVDAEVPIPGIGNAALDDIDPRNFSEQETHTSFIMKLDGGVRVFCTPEATIAVARLLTFMQPVSPIDMVDSLHIDAISEIFRLRKEKVTTGKSTDFSIQIPSVQVRFANSSPSKSTDHLRNEVDQYDFSLLNFAVTARTGFAAMEARPTATKQEAHLLHLRIKSADVSAKERFNDIDDPQTAVNAGIEDVLFWMRSHDTLVANLSLKVIEVATRSSKVEYLASLVHRTSLLAAEIGDSFLSLSDQQRNRLQIFTFLVATEGQRTTDPLFLTRPSYVLRSAPNHLRINDTWKVVTRLRHMFNSLDRPMQQDVATRLLHNTDHAPEDAAQKVLAVFDQWRSWDLTNVIECVAMRRLYGPALTDDEPVNHAKQPAQIGLDIGLLSFQLDPGPKQNELTLKKLASKFTVDHVKSNDSDSALTDQPAAQATTLEIYSSDASIHATWELCGLLEGLIKLYTPTNPKPPRETVEPSKNELEMAAVDHLIHVVVATEKSSITLDTINVRVVSITQGIKGSVIIKEKTGSCRSISIMLAAEAATSKLRGHFQELILFQLRRPSVYASYDRQIIDGNLENIWKSAANCQELSFIVRQDPLALLEVADLVIGDEIAQLHNLSLKLPNSPPKPNTSTLISPRGLPAINRINVALFLDMYHISVPLLQSLTYNISGVVARASIAARQGLEIIFDFDIKENSHDIQTQIENKSRSISLLQMPPTNGRITSHTSPTETLISVFASLEPVQFDAAAIHSLLTALNRPEIANVINEIRENMRGIQKHIDEIFGPKVLPSPRTSPKTRPPLIYDAHMTFAGLDIFADTSGGYASSNAARLSFNIGCVQLEAANRLEQFGPVLSYPEVHVGLRHIMFDLSRVSDSGLESCGNFAFAAHLTASSKTSASGDQIRSYHVKSEALDINLFAETASTVVNVMGHLQDRIKDLDLSREVQYLQKIRKPKPRITVIDTGSDAASASGSTALFTSMYSLELLNIQISWIVGIAPSDQFGKEKENLVLSFKRIDLSTRKENSARLTIEDLLLQMVPASQDKSQRSLNSALLPEVIFNVAFVSTIDARRLAFQAAGKSLDLRLTSQFMIPAADLKKSIESATQKVSAATASWINTTTFEEPKASKRKPFLGRKRMESLLVDADFAGAVVQLQGNRSADVLTAGSGTRRSRQPQSGRYGQFSQDDPSSITVLRAPGLAWKVEFKDNGADDPSLNAEVKVDASSNTLYPTVVPLVMEISSSMKDIISDGNDIQKKQDKASPQRLTTTEDDNILTTDPTAVLGRTRLNLGVRICTQEFSLSCQPIARVAATARFDDIYLTINTVRSVEHGHFFAASAAFTRLQASVQHVYSRESTGSFDVDSIVLSLMNSKHVSGISGLSAILKISPMKVLVNAKQLQDFLLFREIWVPPEIRQQATVPPPGSSTLPSQTFSVHRYQQVAATGAFPWNATVSIAELDVQLDLGQAIGKSAFMISNFWISSKKNSDWEQNLCLGFDKVGVDSTGRMSGFVALQNFRVRTSITWPEREKALNQTPLIQGSMGFTQLRVKAAFDYQAFLVADITTFEFSMYNVRNGENAKGDRLVAILDGDSVQVFCTTTTASQALALYQAFQRLVQEKRTNYETSLNEIERFMKRKSSVHPMMASLSLQSKKPLEEEKVVKSPISLHTDVVVTLKAVNIGAFPSTFFDSQVFKLEALNAQARFAVAMDEGRIHSGLGLTLGQLRIGLAGVKRPAIPKSTGEISVEEVVESATGSRGGTILKVPKVEATMETWQKPASTRIEYIFKSSFEGKVEVGWNYSRISYIRGMYGNHSRALAQRLGKPLPPSAVKITGVPDEENEERKNGEQQKITAEVTVPQSKYEYTALEPPIIETPQLRDMGEATPPLEWIGLHRDRLPNLTHQIVIVTLLEVATEVEDAYARILGSS